MSQERAEELWSRFLNGEELTPQDKTELLDLLEHDPDLRRELLDDDYVDGLLRVRSWKGAPSGAFVDSLWHRVDAEEDGKSFLERLQTRLDADPAPAEVKPELRPLEETPSRGTRISRRTRRRMSHEEHRPLSLWRPAVAVAGVALFVALLIFSGPGPSKKPGPRVPVASPGPRDTDLAGPQTAKPDCEHVARKPQEPTVESAAEAARLAREEQERIERIEREMRAELEAARAKLKPAAAPVVAPAAPPAPAPEAPRPATEARVVHVRVESLMGPAFILSRGAKRPAREGDDLVEGEGFETSGLRTRATLVYPDKTRLELKRDTVVDAFAEGGLEGAGKRVALRRGNLWVEAVPQPRGRAMILTTVQAEVRVVGTKFRLEAEEAQDGWTLLDVKEGSVRLTRTSDGKAVTVISGHHSVAAAGVDLARVKGESAPLLRDGLLGHWGFDEGKGTSVQDLSGKGREGIVTAGRWVTGRFGHAMLFEGQVKGSGVLCRPAVEGTGPLSVAGWVRTRPNGKRQTLIRQWGPTEQSSYGLEIDPQGRLGFSVRDAAGAGFSLIAPEPIADGKWHGVVGTRDADGTGRLYVDGTLTAVSPQSRPAVLTPVSLGLAGLVCCYLAGEVDDVRVYDRALAPEEAAVLAGKGR